MKIKKAVILVSIIGNSVFAFSQEQTKKDTVYLEYSAAGTNPGIYKPYVLEADGIYRMYYSNGKIEEEGKFIKKCKRLKRMSVKHGLWKYYSEVGILIKEEEYKKGKLIKSQTH